MSELQETERRVVRPLPALAKTPAVRRLADALTERGHSTASANAIAYAVCDPSTVRRQLDQPSEIRVAEGALQVIHTSVWAYGVLPFPGNPRTLPAFAHATAAANTRRRPLPREVDSAEGFPELVVHASDSDLIGALDAEMSYLATRNSWDDSIAANGVREPVTLVPLVLEDPTPNDFDDTRAVLAAVDGSSRTSSVYRILQIEAADAIRTLAGKPRNVRQRISDVLALSPLDATQVEETELAMLRALVIPAIIVVGYDPDPGKPASLKLAIESRLGSLHIEPPQQWSPASRYDMQVDVVLAALVEAQELDQEAAAWFAGDLTPSEAIGEGFSEKEDVRAAHILKELRGHARTSNAALRRLTSRRNPGPGDRVAVAAEAALRAYRADLSDQRAASARTTLQAIWTMPSLALPWDVPIETRSSKTVRDDALAELSDNGRPGPHIRELLLLGTYWLVRHNLIRKATRGGDKDRRPLVDVLELVISTPHGIRLLHNAVIDGRNGRTPAAVDEHGQTLKAADGSPLPATELWIRRTWPVSATTHSNGDNQEDLPSSPEADLARRESAVRNAIVNAREAVVELEDPRHEGAGPLVLTQGLTPNVVDEILNSLTVILGKLSHYRDIAVRAQDSEPDDEDSDETDAGHD